MSKDSISSKQELIPAQNDPVPNPFEGVDFAELELSLYRPRTLFSVLLSGLVTCMTFFALIPLFAVLWMLIWRGGQKLSLALFTQLPPAPLEQGGGFGNAIVGTLIMVGLAGLISVPFGILTGVFLAQAQESKLAGAVRFAAKVLTGFPSILAGVFAYGAVVLVDRRLFRSGRRDRAFDSDAADDYFDVGKRHRDGAGENEGSFHRHGRDGCPDRVDGAAADRDAGNTDRHHAGRRARGW